MKKYFTKFLASFLLCCLFAQVSNAQVVFTDSLTTGVTFFDFGGSTNLLSTDPSQRYSGTSSLKIAVPAAGYTGGAFKSATPKNLTTYNAVSFWAKASAAKTLNVAGCANNALAGTNATEWNAIPLTTTWTKYIVPIANPAKLTAEDGLFHFAEGSDEGAYTIWMDDIKYETLAAGILGTPVPAIATETTNLLVGATFQVNGTSAVIPVNGVNQNLYVAPANFTFLSSVATIASFDAFGQGTALAVGTTLVTAKLGTVNANGTKTVIVGAATNPAIGAPVPTRLAANVISLFSNAYTNVPVDTWSAVWDNADVANYVIGTTDTTKKYTNLVYAGIEFTSRQINATAMTGFHLDFWTPNATNFNVKLVDFGANGAYGGGDDTESEVVFNATSTPAVIRNGWVSLDIPMSAFTALGARAHMAQMVLSSSNSTVFVDNVYFYNAPVVVVPAPLVSAPVPTRPAASVISMFSNAYTNVLVDTWATSWGSATLSSYVIGATDSLKKYTNLGFTGIEATTSPINATNFPYFHIDMWTPDANSFRIKLVDFGANGIFGGGDDTEFELAYTPTTVPAVVTNNWVSFNIPLSAFTGLASKAHIAQIILSTTGNSIVYVDNVYFFKTLTGTQDVNFVNNLFKINPSVVNEQMTITTDQVTEGNVEYTISNLLGQTVNSGVLTVETTTVSTANLSNGMYVVSARVGTSVQTQKVVIQH
jgi:Secretion system C-terminal sorting domain